MTKFTTKTLKLAEIYADFDRNPRDGYNVESLSAQIEEQGLLQPLTVAFDDENGLHRVVQGHRRFKALMLIEERSGVVPEIRANVYRGLTYQEEIDLLMDHGSQMPLDRPSEIHRTVATLFRAGFSETHVALKCDEMFARVTAKPSEKRAIALAMTNSSERAQAIKDVWRNRLQMHHYLVSIPRIAEETFLGQCRNQPEHATPKMTQTRIRALYTAHKQDRKATESADADYTIDPQYGGDIFSAKWAEFMAADKTKTDKAEDGEARAKRKSASEIEDSMNMYSSKAVRGALNTTLGNPVSDLEKWDNVSYKAETIFRVDNAWWMEHVVAKYDEIRATERKAATSLDA